MKVVVKLFAGARELAGNAEVEIELPPHAQVGTLREALLQQIPALGPLLPHAMFAVNANYSDDNTVIPENAELACIPPVSGG